MRRRHPKVHLKPTGRRDGDREYTLMVWTAEGKRQTESLGYVTPTEAEEHRKDKEAALRLGVKLDGGPTRRWNVDDVVGAYLDDLEARAGATYTTNEGKRLVYIRDHLGSIVAEKLTRKRLQLYAAARSKETTRTGELTRKSSIREEINAIRRAMACARDLGHIDCPAPDPPDLAFLPDDMRPARRLTEAEVARLLEAARVDIIPGLGSMLEMMAWSGRRPIAIFALRRKDCARLLEPNVPRAAHLVWWERDKGGRERGWGPLTEPAHSALLERLEEMPSKDPEALVWTRRKGDAWTPEHLSRPFDRCTELAELEDVQPYDLRRFACTKILAATANAKVAIRFTGHKTVQTLLRYVFDEVDQAESAAPSIGWTPAPLRLVDDGDEGDQ